MENIWFCQIKGAVRSITVGDKLILLCDGESKVSFKKEQLSIEFLNPDHVYSLVLLEVLESENNFLVLKAAPYRTGSFEHPFYISDGEQFVKVENLSFEVQSLLTDKDTKPADPFGPFFINTGFIVYFLFFTLCFIIGLFVFFYRFFKRTRFVKKIFKRESYSNPSQAFIVGLRRDHESVEDLFENLEIRFKIFLEDCFLIPVHNQKTKSIMKQLKKYHPLVYQNSAGSIRRVLNELSSADKTNYNYYLKLKKVCQNVVFSLEDKK